MLQEQFLRVTNNEIIITFTSAFNNQYNYYRGLISVFFHRNMGSYNDMFVLGNNLGLSDLKIYHQHTNIGSSVTPTFNGLLTSSGSNNFLFFIPNNYGT